MKAIGVVVLVLVLASCLSTPLIVIPSPKGLGKEMESWISRYGDPDGFQVRSLQNSETGFIQVEVIFVWTEKQVFAVFQYFDGTWYMVHSNVG